MTSREPWGEGLTPKGPRMPVSGRGAEMALLISGPLIGADGKPLNLATGDFKLSEGKIAKQFLELQASRSTELDKLNSKLRREFDALKLANKSKMRQLQVVSAELSQVERIAAGDRPTSSSASSTAPAAAGASAAVGERASAGAGGRAPLTATSPRAGGLSATSASAGSGSPITPKASAYSTGAAGFGAPAAASVGAGGGIAAVEARTEVVSELCADAKHSGDMYSFMLARLREEVKGLDVGIAALSGDLKGSLSRQDAAALALHQAQAQRTRAVALVHALSRHLEVGRAQRRLKRERMEASIAGQEAKLREMDERDKKRLTMSLMPRGDLDEDGEDRLKQLFLVRKVYLNMLQRRLRDDARRADRLAQAYQRIKGATGLEEVGAIIDKYRNRDTTMAALQAQMRAARDRVDTLTAERRQLVWSLDEAATLGASATEARALYHSVEEYDRRTGEATRRVREARERLDRLSVLLEGCRASLAGLLERVGLDASPLEGIVAGTAGAPPPSTPLSGVGGAGRLRRALQGGARSPSGSPSRGGRAPEGGAAGAGGAHSFSFPAGSSSASGSSGGGAGSVKPPLPGSRASAAGEEAAGGAGKRAGSAGPAGAPGAGAGAGRGRRASSASRRGAEGEGAGRPTTASSVASGEDRTVAPAGPGAGGAAGDLGETGGSLGLRGAGSSAVVQPDALELALTQLETRLSGLLSHLAAIFEREEAAVATSAKGKGAKARRAAAAATSKAAGGAGEGEGGAHRMSVSALADKASSRVFLRMMTTRPDTSERNVRIAPRAPSPPPQGGMFGPAAMLQLPRGGADAGAGASDEVASALQRNVADLGKLLQGGGAGAVVDRYALKRLSAMVSTSMGPSAAAAAGGKGGRRIVAGAGAGAYGGAGAGAGSAGAGTGSPRPGPGGEGGR